MSSKTKSVTAVLIVLALVAGVGMTKAGSKYKTQEKVNLIFANVTSNSAKKAGEKFKELVEEYSDGDITVDLFRTISLVMTRQQLKVYRMEILILQYLPAVVYQHYTKIITFTIHHICS